jgi:tRNA dimethylallyltransferase
MDSKPLVVIVGPTASGKSELALKIAAQFGGEIICADSRTVYRGMDIGTAKATKEEQTQVKHHLLNIVAPGQSFNTYDFKRLSLSVIADIHARNNLPLLVGGTGLYIDSIIFDYQFPKQTNPRLRERLNKMDIAELYSYCKRNYITLPDNEKNRRHIITAIACNGRSLKRRSTPIKNTLIVGIATDKNILKQKIAKRAEYIFSHGVVEEAKKLGEIYGWENESMTANIYPIIHALLKDEISLDEAKQKSITLDWQLARRQLTWLKRNPYIRWLSLIDAERFLTATLAKIEQK